MTGGYGFDPELLRAALEASSEPGKRRIEEAMKKASQPGWKRQLDDTVKAAVQVSTPDARRRIDETVKLGVQMSSPESRRQLDELARVVTRRLAPTSRDRLDELARTLSVQLSPTFRRQLDEIGAQAAQFRTRQWQDKLDETIQLCLSADEDRGTSVLATIGAVRDEMSDDWPVEKSTVVGEEESLRDVMSARFGVDLPELDDQFIETIEEIYRAEGIDESELSAEVEFLKTDSRTSRAFKRATESLAQARNWTQDRAAGIVAAGYMAFICFEWGEMVESYEWATQLNNSLGAMVVLPIVYVICKLTVNGPDKKSADDGEID